MITTENIKDIRKCFKQFKLQFAFLTIIFLSAFYCTNCTIQKEPSKVWDLRGKIVTLTEGLKGLPYRFGGYDIEGFDCSGLVYYVYDSFGITLPRTAKKQAKIKKKTSLKHAKPGDILAFKLKRRWHTAIYSGDNTFIHSPSKKSYIRKERLNAFWKKRLKAVIQILD